MNNIHRSDFSKICRICLKMKISMSLLYNTELIHKLYDSVNIKILDSNDLPNSICDECTEHINIAFNLKQLCIYSQQILTDIIKIENCDENNLNTKQYEENTVCNDQSLVIDDKEELSILSDEKDEIENDITDVENIEINNSKLLTNVTETNNSKTDETDNYKCSECGKCFRHFSKYKRHKIMHIPKSQRLNYCTLCDKTYFREETFFRHQKICHGSNPQPKKPSVCDLCGKSVIELKNHMRLIHTNNKPHECPTCNKKFVYRHYLNIHISRVHEGVKQDKPHLCNECGKSFYTTTDLKTHLFHHLGQKPFKCQICGEEFRWKGGLRGHMKKHSNNRERKHACTECDKKFFCLQMLKSHMRIHTGERPYLCKICQKSFTQTGSLSNHMKTHNILRKIKT